MKNPPIVSDPIGVTTNQRIYKASNIIEVQIGKILRLADAMYTLGQRLPADGLYDACDLLEKARVDFVEAWSADLSNQVAAAGRNSTAVVSAVLAGLDIASNKKRESSNE